MSEGTRTTVLTEQGKSTNDESGAFPVGMTLLSAAIAAALLTPIAWLFLRVTDLGLGHVWGLTTKPSTLHVLGNSVALVVGVTAGSILLGVPLAVLTVQTDLPFRRFFTVVAALPLVIPSYIGAFTYVSAFGPRGILANALAPVGIDRVPSIYGFHGAGIVLTLYVYPYVYLTTRAALLSFDGTLVEAARTLNHTKLEAFRRVTLPQIVPAIAAGSLLVALYTLSDFGTPTIMRVQVFTSMIFTEYQAFARDYAVLLSVQLVAVTLVILAIESRIGGGDTSTNLGSGRSQAGRIELGAWKAPAMAFCGLVALFTLAIPIGVLLVWLDRGSAAAANVGLGFAFDLTYAWNSVFTSAVTALVAVVVSIPVAYLSSRTNSRLTTAIDRSTYVGYAVPGIVIGLALIVFAQQFNRTVSLFGHEFVLSLYQTLPLLVFAYVVRFVPQSMGAVRSSLLQVDPKLEEAARSLGHSRVSTFRRVTLPLVAPGLAAGGALVFLTTMKELPATLMLRPFGFNTIVTYIWRVQEAGYYGQAAVPALALVGISALSMLVILAREHHTDK